MSLAGDYYYVPNAHVAVWEAEGWVALPALDGTGHGLYSTLMRWAGEGEMVKPGDSANWRDIQRPQIILKDGEPITGDKMLAKDMQVDGDHYVKLKIQPMEYSMANGLDACQHTIIKYVTRFRDKGGIKDLEKARHTIDLLIEIEAKKNGQG